MGGHNWGHWTHSKLCHWNFPVLVVCRRVAGQTQARESCNTSELLQQWAMTIRYHYIKKKISNFITEKAKTPPSLPFLSVTRVCTCAHRTHTYTHTHAYIHKTDKRQVKWLTLLWSREQSGCKDANLACQFELCIYLKSIYFREQVLLIVSFSVALALIKIPPCSPRLPLFYSAHLILAFPKEALSLPTQIYRLLLLNIHSLCHNCTLWTGSDKKL